MTGPGELPILAEFDFRQLGPQTWDIGIETDGGRLLLSKGGAMMSLDGRVEMDEPPREYPALYERFAALIRTRSVDVDLTPLSLVEDALRIGRRLTGEAFAE
jgi:D-galactose 1-dehydrogenase